MKNKNPCNFILKVSRVPTFRWVRNRNTLCHDYDQSSLLERHNTRLFLYSGREKHCDEGAAIRLDRIMAHFLYPRIFNKHQQKTLKEALRKRKECLYDK